VKPYYEQDGITIYHADARDVLPGLERVGLVLTDPPYAIGAGRGEWSATAAVAISLHEAAKRVAKGGALVAFTTTSGRGIEFTQGAIAGKLPFNRLLTWSKTGGRSRALSPWRWDSVAILLFGSAPQKSRDGSSVYVPPAEYPRPSGHPAELPEGLADWLYSPFDADGLVTVDPFMGSGRLLEPAIRAGRRVIGIDVEERYCEDVANRLSRVLTA
jgi:DNA modification methylase